MGCLQIFRLCCFDARIYLRSFSILFLKKTHLEDKQCHVPVIGIYYCSFYWKEITISWFNFKKSFEIFKPVYAILQKTLLSFSNSRFWIHAPLLRNGAISEDRGNHKIWSQISKVYFMARDYPPPPPAFGLIYKGAIGQPRLTTSLCNLLKEILLEQRCYRLKLIGPGSCHGCWDHSRWCSDCHPRMPWCS